MVILPRNPSEIRRHKPEMQREAAMIPSDIAESIRACGRGESRWPLLLTGSPGCGKTRAALHLTDWVQSPSRYYTLVELANEIRRADAGLYEVESRPGDGYRVSAASIWRDWSKAKLAVLDEIGARGNVSDFQYEVLKKAIDDREEKPLIVISNLDVRGLQDIYDDRIISRLCGGTICQCSGPDLRVS